MVRLEDKASADHSHVLTTSDSEFGDVAACENTA
jgi:hypothetical protein